MLIVKNWRKFQHYSKRKPPWIKLHRCLLDDFEFGCLPIASKALAPCLWLLAAEYENGEIPLSNDAIAYRLRMPQQEFADALLPLLNGKFINEINGTLAACKQNASSMLAPRKQPAIPRDREQSTEKKDSFGRSPTATRPEDEDSFEEFWKVYPRRSGANPKHPARLKFLAALKAGTHAQEIISGARTYAGRERSKVGTEFIAQAKTWLNQRCWQDYAPGGVTNGHAAPDSVSDFQARWKANAEKQLKEREELEAVRGRKSG